IDALRADAVTPDLAPRLSHFKEHAIGFDAHYSGGNSSRAGMFSIFYGLPGTYWEDFANFARTPVLIDLFPKYNYDLGLFPTPRPPPGRCPARLGPPSPAYRTCACGPAPPCRDPAAGTER